MLNTFPNITLDSDLYDLNPAIQLYGLRLFTDQTNLEFLAELLLVAFSPKSVDDMEFSTPLPSYELLKKWPKRRELKYAPKSRLNLKLFSFLGSSKLDTRHKTHRDHLKNIDELLKENMLVNGDSKENVIRTMENLFLGFQGSGTQRTWCAQSFTPICPGFLNAETLWNETEVRKYPVDSWEEVVSRYTKYFSVNKHRFLARGGEVLYLQICNALRQDPEIIASWAEKSGVKNGLTSFELDPKWLHEQLNSAFKDLMQICPKTVTDLAEFIDSGVEFKTSEHTDYIDKTELRYTECGWCPQESWQEGYLFAVEVFRICRAEIDLMERLDLLEMACAMQILRSLAMQSDRQLSGSVDYFKPSFRFAISDPEGNNTSIRQISKDTLRFTQKMIYDAIRTPVIQSRISPIDRTKVYREADRRYGYKLFINIAKRIGIVIPRRGSGMRFVLNEKILRFLVITLVPSKRMTYDSFKEAAEIHFGLAIDERALSRANYWVSNVQIDSFDSKPDEWFQEMLEASGFLRKLSDSCALVENPSAIY